jgi:hypothetical protein
MPEPANVYISYHHKDKNWVQSLMTHLKPFIRQGVLEIESEQLLESGDNWHGKMFKRHEKTLDFMEDIHIAIILVSPDYLSSDSLMTQETPEILKYSDRDKLKVIPVLVRPSVWSRVEYPNNLRNLQVYPENGQPLSLLSEPEIEREMVNLTFHICDLAQNLQRSLATVKTPESFNTMSVPSAKTAVGRLAAITSSEKYINVFDEAAKILAKRGLEPMEVLAKRELEPIEENRVDGES